MNDKFSIDTNVAVYAFDSNEQKRALAVDLLSQRPVISVQVINETINVQVRKLKQPLAAAQEVAAWLMDHCEVVPQTADDIRLAMALCQRLSLSHWDALILATALRAGCERIYSEDMQHGLWVSSDLQILNPFSN